MSESTAPESFATVDDGIQSITASAVADTIAANPEPVEETPSGRDERGRFTPKEPSEAPTAETAIAEAVADATQPVVEDPLEESESNAITLPEGFVHIPKVERELATPFTLHDKDGELDVPDVQIKFNANGRERTEPLDKVVRLAQMGVFNAEREASVQQTKAEVQQASQRIQQVEAYARQLEAERTALLSSDEAYLTARAQYEAQNTPEARMQAQQQQIVQERNHMEFRQAADQGERFFSSELSPSVEAITKALPTVSLEEIGAKLLLVSDQFKVHTPFGSIIPPNAYQHIRQAIVNEVVPWAQQIHDYRETERRTTTAKTDAEKLALQKAAESARVDAQKAKTLVGKAGKSAAGRVAPNTAPPKPIRNVDDAESSALEATLEAMGMRKAS